MRRSALPAALLLLAFPPAARAQDNVRITGEVRARAEVERTRVPDSRDAFSLLRTRLGVEAELSPRARVFAQLQDARVFGEEASTTDARAARIDLHQAWLQYGGTARGANWSLRAGRQELGIGNERLIGAVGWSNTGRSFDALRATVGTASWRVSGFAATIDERGPRHGTADDGERDHLLLGGAAQRGLLEVFALHDMEAAYRQFSGVDRTTVGARLARTGDLSASIEGAWQLGNQLAATPSATVAQDIGAWLLGARIAHALPLRPLPRLGLGLDILSGDDDPADAAFSSFNTLYATNHKFYGYLDLFLDPAARTQDRGLVDGMASAVIALPRALALEVDAHLFALHEHMAPSASRALGLELDLTLPVSLGTGQQLQLGYSTFRNGAAAPLIGIGGEGDVWHWAYIMATFSFGARPAPAL